MNKVIIFKNEEGGVSICTPTEEALETWTVDEIAKKDVPHGVPYLIMDHADLPEDRTFRMAWDIDDSLLISGIGSVSHEFPITGEQ